MNIARAPFSVTGYHGCDRDVAQRLIRGEPFQKSSNDYDWLGSGVYFWEYAPYRARDWALTQFGNQYAVLQADVLLGDCLNLLDTDYFSDLHLAHGKLVEMLRIQKIPLPINRRNAHRLDRLVIDEFCDQYKLNGGCFDTVCGCFPEGLPLYEGSKLLSHTHVQIAVRNTACIRELKLVNFE